MKDWFQNLEDREQVIVLVGAFFTAFALLYLLLWRPLSISTAKLEKTVEAQQETLSALLRLEGRASPPARDGAKTGSGDQSLVVLVSQSVDRFKLGEALKSSQPGSGDTIRVQFDNAPFDTMISWLGELQSRYGLSVQGASFNRRDQNGRVDSSLTLERRR